MAAFVTTDKYSFPLTKAKKVFVTGGSGFVGGSLIQTLVANGMRVCAIARSSTAIEKVKKCGADSVTKCDLSDVSSLESAMKGCDAVFHCAALTDLSKPWSEFLEANVRGTRNVLLAATNAGVNRVVHVSSEAALVRGVGFPLDNVDETLPLPNPDEQVELFYPRSKNMAERVCVEFASSGKVEVVIVRPRLIWGYGDTVVLPELIAMSQSFLGFSWIAGAEYGTSSRAYFITDDEISTQKTFLSKQFLSQGIDPSKFGSLPMFLARWVAWTGLVEQLSTSSLALIAQEMVVDNSLAKRELGYKPIVSMDQGFEEIARK